MKGGPGGSRVVVSTAPAVHEVRAMCSRRPALQAQFSDQFLSQASGILSCARRAPQPVSRPARPRSCGRGGLGCATGEPDGCGSAGRKSGLLQAESLATLIDKGIGGFEAEIKLLVEVGSHVRCQPLTVSRSWAKSTKSSM